MILLSGGFDPIHPGHIEMIRRAASYGEVWVALNSDDWLVRKKGFFFQTWKDRAKILESIKWVDRVVDVDDSDDTVCEALLLLAPDCFGNGGDRTGKNTPELDLCEEMGIEAVFGLGDKISSSSDIGSRSTVNRLWGRYTVLDEGPWYKVKRLVLDPGKGTSRQRHFKRAEFWFMENGRREVNVGEWHKLENKTDHPMTVIEVQTGICEENDIERL